MNAAAKPDVDALLAELEADLALTRTELKDVARRSQAFLNAAKTKRDEGLIARIRRQIGLN